MSAVIGLTEEGKRLLLADSARVSGLYVLGKPRVGKSWLLISLILQDMANGHGVFFLDPHGDAIDYLLHCPSVLPRLLVLRPDDPHFTFGINPLECSDIADATLRNDTFTKAKAVFDKLWRNTFEEKPWLQLILQNTIYAFIENRGLTLTEFSLFLRDPAFRAFVVSNMRYNRQVIDYWLKTFASKSKHDQEAQMEAAQTRVEIMLSHPYVRDIVGQSNSTINFNNLISEKRVILLRLSNSLQMKQKRSSARLW